MDPLRLREFSGWVAVDPSFTPMTEQGYLINFFCLGIRFDDEVSNFFAIKVKYFPKRKRERWLL